MIQERTLKLSERNSKLEILNAQLLEALEQIEWRERERIEAIRETDSSYIINASVHIIAVEAIAKAKSC